MDHHDSKVADVRSGYYVVGCPLQQDHLVASSLKNELQSPSFAIPIEYQKDSISSWLGGHLVRLFYGRLYFLHHVPVRFGRNAISIVGNS